MTLLSDKIAPDQTLAPQPNTLAFLLPFIALMALGLFSPEFSREAFGDETLVDVDAANQYIALIAVQVAALTGIMIWFWATYLRHFPMKVSPLSFIVGAVGIVLWVGICNLNIERTVLSWVGLEKWAEVRVSFNPFQQIESDGIRGLFFGLRFTLLALLVPIAEELFLRGWFVRWFQNPEWQNVKLKAIGMNGLLVIIAYAVATHPGEALAAIVWFSLVSWLMLRTGNLWDCVVAHAVTNLLLGIYIVQTSSWHLW